MFPEKKDYNHSNSLICLFFFIKANYSGNQIPIALNYNSNGVISLQLPQGPDTDSYFVYLFVNVIDDTDGKTVYYLTTPVQVTPNNNLANSLANSIANNDASNPVVLQLNSGNLNLVSKNVIALATVFNIQSTNNGNGSTTNSTIQSNQVNNQVASLREFLVTKISGLSVSDISSIKVIASALSAATQSPNQISTNTAVRADFIF